MKNFLSVLLFVTASVFCMEYDVQNPAHELQKVIVDTASKNSFAGQIQQDVNNLLQNSDTDERESELQQIFSLQNELDPENMQSIEFKQSDESWAFKKFPYLLAATGAGLIVLDVVIGFYS